MRRRESFGVHHSGLVTGTRVDVRNFESTFPLCSNQFAATSQRNFGFHGPKCAYIKKPTLAELEMCKQ
jgi:hypothetical protein